MPKLYTRVGERVRNGSDPRGSSRTRIPFSSSVFSADWPPAWLSICKSYCGVNSGHLTPKGGSRASQLLDLHLQCHLQKAMARCTPNRVRPRPVLEVGECSSAVPASCRGLIQTSLLTKLQGQWPSSAVASEGTGSIRLDLDHANPHRSGTTWWVDY